MRGAPGGIILRAAVAAGLVAVVGVELASIGSWLSVPSGIVIGLVALVGFGWLAGPAVRAALAGGFGLEAGVVMVVAAVTLAIALIAAPNTWDSLTYHLPRIDHWLLRGTVAHYATAIDRQIWQPPFAEYLVLQARSLGGGGDRLANLPQWAAAVGSAIAAARIAALLGLPRAAAWTAALVAITIPAVVVQATSTQNDLIAAFWVMVVASLALEAVGDPDDRSRWPWIGGALALAVGTKGTALVFGLPWLVVFGAVAIRRSRREGAVALAGIGLIVALVNGPWTFRNIDTYGNPLGDPVVQKLLRPGSLRPQALLANLVANGSVHWGVPSAAALRATDAAVVAGFTTIGADPKELFPYFGGYRVVPWSTDEDQVGAPLLFLVGLIAMVLTIRRWRRLEAAERLLVLGIVAGLVLFGIGVRWQPFNGRLQLTGLLLLAPLVVAALWRIGAGTARAFGVVATVMALPPLLLNASRPLIGGPIQLGPATVTAGSILTTDRVDQYFARAPEIGPGFRQVVARLVGANCREVAVKAGYDSWEYPLWALARSASASIRFQQNWVENPTRMHQPPAPLPCAVVAIDQPATWVPEPFTAWPAVIREGRITLWMPEPTPTRTP